MIHSLKLAQALPDSSSLILFNGRTKDKRTNEYDIEQSERGYFIVKQLSGKDAGTTYHVFAANIAWVRMVKEAPQAAEPEAKKAGRPKKGE